VSVELVFPLDEWGGCGTPWGDIEHSDPRPDRGEVGHLMLCMPEYADRLLSTGPELHHGALHSVTESARGRFAHVEYGRARWTWELLPAHFSDGQGPPILLGKWPD
jgi:hypothetical protein